jgi:hypothetical protein
MATADIEYNRRMHYVTTLLGSIVIGVGSVADISDFWRSGSWTTGMESSYTSEFAFGLPGTGSVPSTKWQGSHVGGGVRAYIVGRKASEHRAMAKCT